MCPGLVKRPKKNEKEAGVGPFNFLCFCFLGLQFLEPNFETEEPDAKFQELKVILDIWVNLQ